MDGVEERFLIAQEVAREAGEVGLGYFRARGDLVVEARDNPQGHCELSALGCGGRNLPFMSCLRPQEAE